MSALAEWNPYARWESNLTLLFNASRRPLLIPSSTAASTPALCLRIVRASLTNGLSRDRDAHDSHASRRSVAWSLGDLVDVAQLAVEQRGAEHRLVGLLHLAEAEQLVGGLLGGVLQQRVAHALDPLAGVAAGAAVLVVLGTADLVGRSGAELHHMKRVKAHPGVRDRVADRFLIPGGHVDRDGLDRRALLVCEPVEERLQRLGVAARRRPHDPALPVIGDAGQELVLGAV